MLWDKSPHVTISAVLCFREQHVITKKGIMDSKLVRLILQWAQAVGHVNDAGLIHKAKQMELRHKNILLKP